MKSIKLISVGMANQIDFVGTDLIIINDLQSAYYSI